MADTYALEYTKEEAFFVAASMYLAMSVLTKDKRGILEALAELLQTDEDAAESAGTKLEKLVLSI